MSRIATSQRLAYLTFDGGSGAQAVDSVVATLNRERVPATFFLTGAFVTAHPSAAARAAALGQVGNHTYSHPHLPTLDTTGIRHEVDSARSAILRTTGRDPQPLFRFPFGDYDGRTLATVNGLGYVAVGWTVDTLGWKGRSGGSSVGEVTARVAGSRAPGQIVLMHLGAAPDGTTLDADALSQVIQQARAAGYMFGTVGRP